MLVPYLYSPLLVELSVDEAARYDDLSAKLAKYGISDDGGALSDGAKAILLKRARIVSSARAKLPLLAKLLEPRRRDTHILIYCGDGRPEGDSDDMPDRQIEEAVAIAEGFGMVCAKYTAETPAAIRAQILKDFDLGRIQALIAIRCLDEGVDVPSTRTAFIMSSSTNPRQFIQRRGRVLRRSPRTGKQKAEIFDFFVVPPREALDESPIRSMRGAVRSQLQRVMEFSSLALNGAAARSGLLKWTREHGLLELWS